jgi:hypothetical protein
MVFPLILALATVAGVAWLVSGAIRGKHKVTCCPPHVPLTDDTNVVHREVKK